MKKSILFLSVIAMTTGSFAQKKISTSAKVSFDATTSLDALPKADNKTVVASIDTKTGAVAFEALVKSFDFNNPMMQEHFNSPKWLDSEQFPSTTFKGKITNLSDVNFNKDGLYKVSVDGKLTLHGVTNDLKTSGIVEVKGKLVNAKAEFTFKLADYKVGNAGGKVASEPKITVDAELK